jgi:hypothetical protein
MAAPMSIQPRLLDKQGACEYLGNISVATLDALVKRGIAKPLLKTKFAPEDLDAAVDYLRNERDGKTALILEYAEHTELSPEGEPLAIMGEDRQGSEGPEAVLRKERGRGVQQGPGAGNRVRYPRPSRV